MNHTGIVLRAQSHLYHVWCEELGQDLLCTLRGRLRKETQKATNILAVGDRVHLSIVDEEQDQGVIEEIYPRTTKLSRKHPGPGRKLEQILAANVDQAVIVMACHKPDYNPNRLDRHLIAALQGGLKPIICLSKCDLPEADEARQALERYVQLGYAVLYTSTVTGEGLDQLRELLAHKISAFVGSSGVGKSSLINTMDPELHLRTREIRERFYKGKHTTTAAELLRLPWGALVVDTPGLREFGLWESKQRDLDEHFEEFGEFAGDCRYGNCTHTHEPGCAVKQAVDMGEIDAQRYGNYLKLQRGAKAR